MQTETTLNWKGLQAETDTHRYRIVGASRRKYRAFEFERKATVWVRTDLKIEGPTVEVCKRLCEQVARNRTHA
jgi:hypothetical protein